MFSYNCSHSKMRLSEQNENWLYFLLHITTATIWEYNFTMFQPITVDIWSSRFIDYPSVVLQWYPRMVHGDWRGALSLDCIGLCNLVLVELLVFA
jgi:hypothetical protein